MTLALCYWIVMLVWLVFSGVDAWKNKALVMSSIVQFILFLLLGWATFGAPIKP